MSVQTRRLKVFSCNSNPNLAKTICELIGIPLGDAQVGKFSDGEIHIQLNESVRGADVYVIQSTCDPVNPPTFDGIVSHGRCSSSCFSWDD
jgi:ribose-phosphate pyrophosphokinase